MFNISSGDTAMMPTLPQPHAVAMITSPLLPLLPWCRSQCCWLGAAADAAAIISLLLWSHRLCYHPWYDAAISASTGMALSRCYHCMLILLYRHRHRYCFCGDAAATIVLRLYQCQHYRWCNNAADMMPILLLWYTATTVMLLPMPPHCCCYDVPL